MDLTELFMMSLANFSSAVICLPLGFIIRTGKVGFLIAGYNTMSKEEQAKWDIKALSRFLGGLLIIMSVVLLAGGIFILLNIFPWIFMIASWSIFTAIIIWGVIYINISQRFKQRG